MKILITGVAGFIGSKVASKFIDEGYEVIGVDDLSSGYKKNIHPKISFFKLDLSNPNSLKSIPEKCELILHLAGQSSGEISFDDPIADLKKNTLSTLNLINYGIKNKCNKILYASSMSVYGDVPDKPISEKFKTNPLSCYGISKLTSEKYLKTFQNELPYINLRMFNVYGPGQDMTNLRQGMISIFLAQALKNKIVHIKGSKERFRDFIHIDDVVDIWFKLAFNSTFNITLNVGTGKRTTIEELLSLLNKIIPHNNFSKGSTLGDQKGIYADNTLLIKNLKKNNFISLSEGLKNLISIYNKENIKMVK